MASWPTTLPEFLASGYEIAPFDQCIRTTMEAGNSVTRRITNEKRDKISLAWRMTHAQFEIFRDWFDSSSGADGGNSWFDIDVESGYSGAPSAKFGGPPSIKLLHGGFAPRWEISASVEVRYA